MSTESIMNFYGALGFEEIEVDDDLTALFFEFAPEEEYALITDSDGAMPENLGQSVIFACYTPEGAYKWSASFKNSHEFKDIWAAETSLDAKLSAIQKHRETNEL